jgi:hypothetical protein
MTKIGWIWLEMQRKKQANDLGQQKKEFTWRLSALLCALAKGGNECT